jgi:uncharacterized protein YbjT (DUF2867 family)
MPAVIKNRALVFGATGLVGSQLVNLLTNDSSYSTIEVFTRKPMDYNLLKVNEHVIDFSSLEKYTKLIKGNDLFICLGTTIRKAGSVAAAMNALIKSARREIVYHSDELQKFGKK